MGKSNGSSERNWCDEHDCPMIQTGEGYECVVERVNEHLGTKSVRDIVPGGDKTPLTLVFQDGHTLPLLCPDCGGALHVSRKDEDEALEQVAGMHLIAVAYVESGEEGLDEPEMLALAFADDPEADPDDPEELTKELLVHLNSAAELTCPEENRPGS